mmetsp:Transcript_65419/g.182016  ORF Transcript_65419/g.182016 Transcript_65419/m.182016 type:complete len:400 (+) Transcript_65419:35-1234(+)
MLRPQRALAPTLRATCGFGRARAAGAAAFPSTPDGHPLVDVSTLLPGGEQRPERSKTLRTIAEAFRSRGYFYARGVDVLPAEYISGVYDYSRGVHGLPVDVKRRFARSSGGSGAYAGPDVGEAELEYEPGSVSTVRSWDYSRARFTLGGSVSAAERYPSGELVQPSYADFLDDLYERQNVLARGLMVAFAEMLTLPPRTFVDMFEGEDAQGDFGTIRLLFYPGNPSLSEAEAAAATSGISPHTDFEAFTLMHQDAPGLQFLSLSGEGWIDAPVRPGEFVVIVGDILERLTNGELRALPHRVVLTPHARSSIIRFNAVAADTVVKPLPEFVTASRPAMYSRVTMKTHMETTTRNLAAGLGAWDAARQRSSTANYLYIDGVDHRVVEAERREGGVAAAATA